MPRRKTTGTVEVIRKTDAEWRAQLTPLQYNVTRKRGTERPASDEQPADDRPGTYCCVCCELPLFDAQNRLDSRSGWPCFSAPLQPQYIRAVEDHAWLQRRIEVSCAACDAHLGHVYPDGPPPDGLRYSINSAALQFKPAER